MVCVPDRSQPPRPTKPLRRRSWLIGVSSLTLGAGLATLVSIALAAPSVPVPAPPSTAPPLTCSHIVAGPQTVSVAWGRIYQSPGCFFFSGPGTLGRDDQLGTSATLTNTPQHIELRFGAAAFSGQRSGERFSLTRRSRHEFSGVWVVDEFIDGRFEQIRRGEQTCRGVRAHYRYRECSGDGPCREGCTISGELSVTGM